MILITSGNYVDDEFASEIGLIPPSFLPVGNKRLYEYQIEFLSNFLYKEDKIYLSIPYLYEIGQSENKFLNTQGVEIIKVDNKASLGNSIFSCLEKVESSTNELIILNGDTLFLDSSFNEVDCVSIHKNDSYYKRGVVNYTYETDTVWSDKDVEVISGFFRFSDKNLFQNILVKKEFDFIASISEYNNEVKINFNNDGTWLDFGHINSYYHSKRFFGTQRSFNELNIKRNTIEKKSSNNPNKIIAEANWFQQIPSDLKLFTPQFTDFNQEVSSPSYTLEYLYLPSLSELLVFGQIKNGEWENIFHVIQKLLISFIKNKPQAIKSNDIEIHKKIYLDKTTTRLNEFFNKNRLGIDCNHKFNIQGEEMTLLDIAAISSKYISPLDEKFLTISHGDLCFSNILYDQRAGLVKCIDPRGISPDGKYSIYGDIRYDVGKLFHSFFGFYDFIIAGKYDLSTGDEWIIEFHKDTINANEIFNIFDKEIMKKMNFSIHEILAINVHLFLSMLPLHDENINRQKAFIANAIRLFKILTTKK